jgi:hypothetical protein
LYGKDYVVEPKGNSPVTPNPAYTGENPVTVTVPATTVTVVQSAPIVQYVYSPAYVPYYPPYYYGYYPPGLDLQQLWQLVFIVAIIIIITVVITAVIMVAEIQ